MPILFTEKSLNNSVYAVWKRNESISCFLDQINLHPEELAQFYGQMPPRILQWLSSRFLLKMIAGAGEDILFLKDGFGKPYISNYSKHVSLSHSGNMIAAIVSDNPTGIDIERISAKTVELKDKFADDKELDLKNEEEDPVFFTRLWTIKEAVYKAYGKKQVKFKEQINIKSNHECFLSLNKNFGIKYDIESHIFHDHVLSIAVARC